jgi:2-methylcitrate dehydratase PrpD
VAGYEVATRVAASVSPRHYASGFHNTGTCTVFGAVVSAGLILGLEGDALAEAMGIAGTTAAGLRQHQVDGSMFDSAFHGARGAQSGIMAAQLRNEGVQGPPAILEGPMGFCAVMSPERDVSRLTRGLGDAYEFEKTTIKAYPTCRFVHGPTEAALELKRRHGIDPARIERVTIETFRQSMEVSDRPQIKSSFDAVTSHQYSAALALVKDNVELSEIVAGANGDSRALALMRKVRVVHDAELEKDFPRCWPHRVTIEMTDGAKHSTLSEYPPGRVTPVPSGTVDRKFLEQASRYLGEAGARAALDRLRGCAEARDMREVALTLAGRA